MKKPAVRQFVQRELRKGTPVVVEGYVNQSTWDGQTYNNISGFRVGIVDWFTLERAAPSSEEDL